MLGEGGRPVLSPLLTLKVSFTNLAFFT
jgi:hypothetical protein